MELKYIIYPTSSLYTSRQFISEVFDTEVKEEGGEYYFVFGKVNFKFLEVTSFENKKSLPKFSFTLKSLDELTHLKEKVDFFYFRQKKKILGHSYLEKSTLTENMLTLFDPDGGEWFFSLSSRSESTSFGPRDTQSYN